MKTTILNGNPDAKNRRFDKHLEAIAEELKTNGHDATYFKLREMDIHFCKGCFGCWHRTPGECVSKDDSRIVLRSMINSEFALLASPIRMGYVTALLKTTVDKFLPLLHPYVYMRDNEMRHIKRYPRYPDWGLLLDKTGDADDQDVEIITELLERASMNFHAKLRFSELTTKPPKELADEIIGH